MTDYVITQRRSVNEGDFNLWAAIFLGWWHLANGMTLHGILIFIGYFIYLVVVSAALSLVLNFFGLYGDEGIGNVFGLAVAVIPCYYVGKRANADLVKHLIKKGAVVEKHVK